MRAKSTDAKPGRSSSIVTALAVQLDATIMVPSSPGTMASIIHEAKDITEARLVLAAV